MADNKVPYYGVMCTRQELHALHAALVRDISSRPRDGDWLYLMAVINYVEVQLAYPKGPDIQTEFESILSQ